MSMKLNISTRQKEELIDITTHVRKFVEGQVATDYTAVLVYCTHTTAGILINENYDPDVQTDILNFLSQKVPETGWKHAEENSAAHIKSSLIGVSAMIPIVDGKLCLGRWQGIWFCEFDGPQERRVVLSVIT